MSRRRTRVRGVASSRLVYLGILVVAALVGSAFVRVTLLDNAVAKESLAVRGQIGLLEAQRSYLQAEVAMRETPEYVVTKARELGYVKPGEGLASVRDASPAQTSQSRGADTKDSLNARLQRWLALFFHQ